MGVIGATAAPRLIAAVLLAVLSPATACTAQQGVPVGSGIGNDQAKAEVPPFRPVSSGSATGTLPSLVEGVAISLVSDVTAPATATVPAVRISPPPAPTSPPIPVDNCDEMTWYRTAAGLPAQFDKIGYRESRCRNEESVRTSCCVSYWQLWVDLHLRDSRIAPRYHDCGVYSEGDVNSNTPADKQRAACATKVLYDVEGLQPWAATA